MTRYRYRPDGLRLCKEKADGSESWHVWDGQEMVAEFQQNGNLTARYLRGVGLLARELDGRQECYLFNAHGDVVQRVNRYGTILKSYEYDAFGNAERPEKLDHSPWRYCGEYYDRESQSYYLRARSYEPRTGRFMQEDTHWNPGNMVYGDNPKKINEHKADPNNPLGLNTYTLVPDITAIMQSSNRYVYCGNNPILYMDHNGNIFMLVTAAVGLAIGGIGGAIYSYAKYGEVHWQNIAAGAAIGGTVGLTGGAAVAYFAAGSATASTGAVLTGIGAAGTAVAGSASTAAVQQTVEKVSNAQPTLYKTLEQGVNFGSKALQHMNEPGRAVPVQTLIDVIKTGASMNDPQGSRALMYYAEMYLNNKIYNIEVLYDKLSI